LRSYKRGRAELLLRREARFGQEVFSIIDRSETTRLLIPFGSRGGAVARPARNSFAAEKKKVGGLAAAHPQTPNYPSSPPLERLGGGEGATLNQENPKTRFNVPLTTNTMFDEKFRKTFKKVL
jgi:hypothetical protein